VALLLMACFWSALPFCKYQPGCSNSSTTMFGTMLIAMLQQQNLASSSLCWGCAA
jgi:hypothetical protein